MHIPGCSLKLHSVNSCFDVHYISNAYFKIMLGNTRLLKDMDIGVCIQYEL